MILSAFLVTIAVFSHDTRAVEICPVYSGICTAECPVGTNEGEGFPYCLNNQICCVPPTTTTTEPAETTEVMTTPTPATRICGFDAIAAAPRILNGNTEQVLNDFSCAWPWMVSIMLGGFGDTYLHSCNGILVSDNKFLTVKSCLENIPGIFKTYASIGRCDISGLPDTVDLPEFDPASATLIGDTDLRLVTLTESVNYSRSVLPACLPDTEDTFSSDTPQGCVMVGRSLGDGRVGSGRVTLQSHSICSTIATALNLVNSAIVDQPVGTFCTAVVNDNVDACDGDEGSAVMCPDEQNQRWVLKGVVQRGTCGKPYNEEGTNYIIDIPPLFPDIENVVFPK